MEDESLTELCKTIYRKHREAIDLIVKYGMVGVGQQVAEELLPKDEYEIIYSIATSVWFLPKTWAAIIPKIGTAWTNRPRPVACWFEFTNKKAHLHFELSAMKPPELRIACLTKLKAAGFSVAKGAFEENHKYSRFFLKSGKITDNTDYEEMQKVVAKLLKSAKPEFPKAELVFRDVFKDQ